MIEFPMSNAKWVDMEMEKKLPDFFEQMLGLREPWYVGEVEHKDLEIHIHIDFKRGERLLSTIRLSGNDGI